MRGLLSNSSLDVPAQDPKARKVCESVCKLSTVLRSANTTLQNKGYYWKAMSYISRVGHKTSASRENEIRSNYSVINW